MLACIMVSMHSYTLHQVLTALFSWLVAAVSTDEWSFAGIMNGAPFALMDSAFRKLP